MGPFASMIGSQVGSMGGSLIGNFLNAGIGRIFKKRALLNDPSNYLKGMERAGLNPLTMGNQTPSQVGQSTTQSQMSSPTEAMMAGVQMAKAMSEIERNKAGSERDRAEAGAVDTKVANQKAQTASIKIQNEIARASKSDVLRLRRATAEYEVNHAAIEKTRRDVQSRFAMSDAEFNNMLLSIQTSIESETGMDKALAQVLALGLANDITRGDAEFNLQTGAPPSGFTGLLGAIQGAIAWATNIGLILSSNKKAGKDLNKGSDGTVGDHPDR